MLNNYIFLVAILLLIFYLHMNIAFVGYGGAALITLFYSFCLLLIEPLRASFTSRKIVVSKSALVLSIFVWYLIHRYLFDIGDFAGLKASLFTTSGGLILFYLLGFLLSKGINRIYNYGLKNTQRATWLNIVTALTLGSFNLAIFWVYINLIPRLRNDLFLLSDHHGDYQRAGNFLIMCSLIASVMHFNSAIARLGNKSIFSKTLAGINFVFYVIYTFMVVYVSQLIGSNNALISSTVILITSITGIIILNLPHLFPRFKSKQLSLKEICQFSKILKIFTVLIFSILLASICFTISIYHFGIDVNRLTISNFGRGGLPGSLNSRMKLLQNNLLVHFSFSPIMGNMRVDEITTGKGTYVHSFFLSTLTHTGLLGFSIIVLYGLLIFREFFTRNYNISDCSVRIWGENVRCIYMLLLFGFVCLIANAATFLTWSPIWFCFGFFAPPVSFRKVY